MNTLVTNRMIALTKIGSFLLTTCNIVPTNPLADYEDFLALYKIPLLSTQMFHIMKHRFLIRNLKII